MGARAKSTSSVRKSDHHKRTYSLRKYSIDASRSRKHSKTVALVRDNSSSIIRCVCSIVSDAIASLDFVLSLSKLVTLHTF